MNENLLSVLIIIPMISSLFAVGAGILVYLRGINRGSHIIFLAFCISVAAWSSLTAGLEIQGIGPWRNIITGLVYITGALMPFLGLIYAMFEVNIFRRGGIGIVSILSLPFFSIVAILLIFPSLIVYTTEERMSFGLVKVFGPVYWVYVSYVLIYGVATVCLFNKKYKLTAGIFKVYLHRIRNGVAMAGFVTINTNLIFPLFGLYDLFWVGPVAFAIMTAWIVFNIARYNLWDLKLITTESFIGIIVATLFIQVFVSDSIYEKIFSGVIMAFILFAGYFLIESVRNEVHIQDNIRKLVQETSDKNRKLKDLDVRKSDFVGMAAHDLKDPITAIQGYASMLLEGSFGKRFSKDSKNAIQNIYDSSYRLIGIISDFMDITNIESGSMKYHMQPINIVILTREVTRDMQRRANSKGLYLKHTISCKGPIRDVVADEGKLRQVFSNLVDNAIKYTQSGGVVVDIQCGSIVGIPKVSIKDTGVGMSQKTIGDLFMLFGRAEGINKVYTDGSGIGLYVAREILKHHGAIIEPLSAGEGKGSEFVVSFKHNSEYQGKT